MDEQHQPEHQVVADGEIIYEGENWQQAFLDAGLNPEYDTIIHLQDGEQGAVLGPVQPSTHPL
jgi:hypothetical protein